MFGQGTVLEVIEPFSFKPSKGRAVEGKEGQRFWITSPSYKNQTHCLIARKGKGSANIGWQLGNLDIERFFKVVT
jgi:hypothetical protein